MPVRIAYKNVSKDPRLHHPIGQTGLGPIVCSTHMWTLGRDSKNPSQELSGGTQPADMGCREDVMDPASHFGQGCPNVIWKGEEELLREGSEPIYVYFRIQLVVAGSLLNSRTQGLIAAVW